MKMKYIIISIVWLLWAVNGLSQPVSDPIYLVLTSRLGENLKEGIVRSISSDRENLGKYPPKYFRIYAERKEIMFAHYNFNIEKISKIRQPRKDGRDEMEIITKPESFLKEISYIDVDEFMKTNPTKEELWALGDKLEFKKIFIIDRSDTKDGQITLTEVRLSVTTKPPHNPGEEVIINGKTFRTLW